MNFVVVNHERLRNAGLDISVLFRCYFNLRCLYAAPYNFKALNLAQELKKVKNRRWKP